MGKDSPLQLAAKYSGIIFLLPSCLLVGFFLGRYLDGRLETAPALTILFFMFGAAAGFFQVFKLLQSKR